MLTDPYLPCYLPPIGHSDPTGLEPQANHFTHLGGSDSFNVYDSDSVKPQAGQDGAGNGASVSVKDEGGKIQINIQKTGNWGAQNDPSYYVDYPLYANGGPAQGATRPDLKGLGVTSDARVTGTLDVESHLQRSKQGKRGDRMEQEHPQGWNEFHKTLSDRVYVIMRNENQRFNSRANMAEAGRDHVQKLYNAEFNRQRVWDRPGGRHDSSKWSPDE